MKKITSSELFRLIRDNSQPLNRNQTTSEIFKLASKLSKCEKDSEEYKHFSNITSDLADFLPQFKQEDYTTLMSFIQFSSIESFDIFQSYAKCYSKITNSYLKALYLKLLSIIDTKALSESFLTLFRDIEAKYPLFWSDLFYSINHNVSFKLTGKEITIK
jgi:hypothetical protein